MLIGYFHSKSIVHFSKKSKHPFLKQIPNEINLQSHHSITIRYKSKINFRETSRENNSLSCSPALVLNERGKERGERKWFSLAIRLSPWIARGWLLEDSTGSWPLLRKVESRNNKGISLSLEK